MENSAFLDGQNIYLSTTMHKICPWEIDLNKLRIYLKDKYNVSQAFYYLGYVDDNNDDLYIEIQKAGFILKFKEHNPAMRSRKKGNIDTDLVFDIMRSMYENKDGFEKIVLVSGDGDYKKLVDFLIKEDKFEKILFPGGNRSSLYKEIGDKYSAYLSLPETKIKIIKTP